MRIFGFLSARAIKGRKKRRKSAKFFMDSVKRFPGAGAIPWKMTT
jgi:hypothetical protein